ncbi:MAG: hypothetical protein GY771_03640 [bacterium]|nr:hypothetical protein [bacterium]
MLYREDYDPMVANNELTGLLRGLSDERDAEELVNRLLKKPRTGEVKQEATATEKA